MNSIRGSRNKVDLKALDKLVSNLLEQQSSSSSSAQNNKDGFSSSASTRRKSSMKLSRWRPTSRSAHSFNINEGSTNYAAEQSGGGSGGGGSNMPTIMESTVTVNNQHVGKNNNEISAATLPRSQRSSWSSSLERTPGAVRNVLRNINTGGGGSEENLNLTQDYGA